MKALLLIPFAALALAAPAMVMAGSDHGGFDGLVHSIEQRYHARAAHIPFMGLISFAAAKATHHGVDKLRIAEFDHFTQSVDGSELSQIVEQQLGPEWQRMIRDTSRNGSEQSLIYCQPEGQKMGLMMVDLDDNEMNVVQVFVDPDHLSATVNEHRHHDHDQESQGDDRQ